MDISFINIYLILWIIATLFAIILLVKRRNNLLLFTKEYLKFILQPWKLVLFFIAFIALCIIANLGLDPTWDIPETIVMSILTYYTAPYAVGIIFRYFQKMDIEFFEFYIAIILLFFSSAWFYDIYVLLFLLGVYPETAFSNLLLSPFFYILAGMMWNLGYIKEKGIVFLYNQNTWIQTQVEKNSFRKTFIFMIPIFLFMVGIFGYFVYINI